MCISNISIKNSQTRFVTIRLESLPNTPLPLPPPINYEKYRLSAYLVGNIVLEEML
jgi:hypothetical protein